MHLLWAYSRTSDRCSSSTSLMPEASTAKRPMIQQRKRPVVRVGPRLAGFLVDDPVVAPAPVPSSIVQVQVSVAALMEAVAAVEGVNTEDTDEKVKQVVRDAFSPAAPVKRGRGRPKKYS